MLLWVRTCNSYKNEFKIIQSSSSSAYPIFTTLEKEHFVTFMIYLTQETHQKVYKGDSITSEGSISHQKDHRCIRRRIYPKGYVRKCDNLKVAILKEPQPQSFFYIIQRSIQKVKRDLTRSKRSTDKSEKLVNL